MSKDGFVISLKVVEEGYAERSAVSSIFDSRDSRLDEDEQIARAIVKILKVRESRTARVLILALNEIPEHEESVDAFDVFSEELHNALSHAVEKIRSKK